MIIVFILVAGLVLGSFVNALVWRVYQQSKAIRQSKVKKSTSIKPNLSSVQNRYSVLRGRSMCPKCHHQLSAKDLIPLLSWLSLSGKCRYCKQSIDWQYPVVELTTAVLFLTSYLFWPLGWEAAGVINFIVWLVMLTGFMALVVYDLRWMLLPNRIVFPLIILGAALALYNILVSGDFSAIYQTALSVAVAGGIFYLLFVISDGRWIGGGDVKLGFLIGLILGDPKLAFLVLFGASLLGTFYVLPGVAIKKVKPNSRIPFGPFLIAAIVLVQLFGNSVIEWYKTALLL